ncbi:MAG: tyrosine-type recombinase/integrase [Chloroflexi bacterium]|nr:tyrosine-type recombinase/integrase [Chloroflexota bacterium]
MATAPAGVASLIAVIDDFLEYCLIEEGLAALTLRTYRQVLRALATWLGPEATVAHLTRPTIRRWQHVLMTERGVDQSTYVKYVSGLRSLLTYLRAENLTELSADDARLPKGHLDLHAVHPLTREEVVALVGVADDSTPWGRRDRAILTLLYSSGMRVAELCALDRKQIRVDSLGGSVPVELAIVGKGRRPRVVFIDQPAQALLAAYLATRDDDYPALFRPYRGKARADGRLTPRMIQTAIDRYARAAGLASSPTPHTLRHSFAIHALQGGADTRVVQAFLGHASLATTQRYTKITDRYLRDSYQRSHQPLTLPAN